jgi:two-component system KDP operon response regulator KdpE
MPDVNRIKGYFVRARDTVRKINQTAANEADAIVEAGDFQINVKTRSARLHGKRLELTSPEFDLLLFLINHPRRLVTNQTRLATNWSSAAIRQTEFLQTLLSLQKKLESVDRTRCYIRTEPWVFYRFYAGASAHEALHEQPDDLTAAAR